MKITSAKYEMGELILTVPRCSEVLRLCLDFKPGEYEIRKVKQRRSLDANAYCWVLIDKLATALNMSKTEIYRREIKEIGGVSTVAVVASGAAEKLAKSWRDNGIGWQAEIEENKKYPNFKTVRLYYGSSVYDTEQMARLIDRIVEDCKACGIETLPPEKLEMMKKEWK